MSKTWKVTVYTGDRDNAGTDAVPIFINVFGKKGSTGEVGLDSIEDNFERNKVDRFEVSVKDVGQPHRLTVRTSNTGTSPNWFLNKIKLFDASTGEMYKFPCYDWLSEDTEQMRSLSCE